MDSLRDRDRIFLCHAHEDKLRVMRVYHQLVAAGFDPWIDEQDLRPGENWEETIPRVLKSSAAVILFLSSISVVKRGYVQREFKLAYDALQRIPDGRIFLIPIKLDECEIPSRFESLHWLTFDETESNLQRVIDSLVKAGIKRQVAAAPVQQHTPSTTGPLKVALSRYDQLRVLEDEVRACVKCRLGTNRARAAFARGGLPAQVMFLGEAPGASEDLTGWPFSGVAGELLDQMILAMGLSVNDVYLANVIKCRAPMNRVPEPDELLACRAHWERQISLVAPKVLVTLGRVAAQTVLQTSEPITRLRGRWHMYDSIPTLPVFHPAYLLRHPEAKASTWSDLQSVRTYLQSEGTPNPQ